MFLENSDAESVLMHHRDLMGIRTSGKKTSHDMRLLALIVAARFRDRAIADMRVPDCLYVWERM